jgi:LysR family transcriptional regulator, benzoate and cis,cis-muconate-responsive activator of ben and cat genes
MAQPPLSRAIQQLERRLGVPLFDRSGRHVALTAAGEVLLDEGRAALAAVKAAERRTQRAAAEPTQIVLAAKSGANNELLTTLLDRYANASGAARVDLQLVGIGEPERMLRDGRADVALLHLPFDETVGFDFEQLHSEGQVALLPIGHPLAKRKRLSISDLEAVPGLPLPRWPEPDGSFAEGEGPAVRDYVQLLQLISLGRACAIVPESSPRLGTSIAVVPVRDAHVVATVIAWPPHSRSRAVAELVATSRSGRKAQPSD